MKALAVLVAERLGGRTRLTTMRSDPPLTFRSTPDGVHLIGSAAGPIGGDELGLQVTVGAGAALTVRTAAASVVLPGPEGLPSSLSIEVDVGAGAGMRWLPEPTVAAGGCDHRATTTLTLAADARLVWREEVILGRANEALGSVLQRLRVDREGRPLLRHDLALGPRWPWSDGPAGVAGARAVGTLLVVGVDAACLEQPETEGVRSAVAELSSQAALLLAVSGSPRRLREALERATESLPSRR